MGQYLLGTIFENLFLLRFEGFNASTNSSPELWQSLTSSKRWNNKYFSLQFARLAIDYII